MILGTGGGAPAAAAADQMADIYRLGDPALSELSLEPLLDELLVRVVEILNVDTAAILLNDDATDELVARAAKGLEEEVERGVRIPVGRRLRRAHRGSRACRSTSSTSTTRRCSTRSSARSTCNRCSACR